MIVELKEMFNYDSKILVQLNLEYFTKINIFRKLAEFLLEETFDKINLYFN